MIRIDFLLLDNLEIDNKLIKQKDYRLEYFIEGNLWIYIDNRKWFFEEYFNLIEFGVSLKSWLNVKNNYTFISIDHDEPIFYFNKDEDNYWIMFSPWQQFQLDHSIQADRLIHAIKNYLEELDKALLNKFQLKLSDFSK
jgi:hypothetical protein